MIEINTNGSLVIEDKVVPVPGTVFKYVCVDDVVVVIADDVDENENVWGIDRKRGNVIWEIPKVKLVGKKSPYVNIVEDDGLIKAVNWCGVNLFLDPRSGDLVRDSFSK